MGNSKSIYYEDCDESVQSTISSEFIKAYSDKNITGISYYYVNKYDTKNKYAIYIYTDTRQLLFKNRLELIKLIEKLDRPFIIIGELLRDEGNQIYFVYGSDKKKIE